MNADWNWLLPLLAVVFLAGAMVGTLLGRAR